MDPSPPDLDATPTDEGRAPTPPPAPPRKSGLGFFAVLLSLYGVLGTAAQAASPVLGLAWSQAFALLLPAVVAASGSNLRPARALQLARRPAVPALALAPVLGAAAFVVAGATMQLTSLVLPARWLEIFDVAKLFERPPLERAALSLAAATLAPFCEEVAFRGWVLTALRTRYSATSAIALSGLLFAIMHLDPVRFSALVLLGAFFAWLTWRAGSIWPAVLAHATNNGLGLALASAGAAATSLQGLPRNRDAAVGALVTLAVGGALLGLLAGAYRRATPAPPPIEDALARADASDPSTAFRFARLPAGALAAITAGVLSLGGLAVLAAARHR